MLLSLVVSEKTVAAVEYNMEKAPYSFDFDSE
jgi:hypothetical protein